MAYVLVNIEIERTPDEIWADLRNLKSHVEWMKDATAIRITSETSEGVGTVMDCDTQVGFIKLTDVIEITSWIENQEMGVRHRGLIGGEGKFTLIPTGSNKTEFRWEEDLDFPLWLGGPIGEWVSKPILQAIWKGNLRRLKYRLEGDKEVRR